MSTTHQSIFMDLLDAVAGRIRSLDLQWLEPTDIEVRRFPHDGERYMEGITIHPARERIGRGTNARDDIGYGVGVSIVKRNTDDLVEDMDLVLHWREQIRHSFIENSCIETLTNSFVAKIEHGEVFDDRVFMRQDFDLSTLVIRCWVRENRHN